MEKYGDINKLISVINEETRDENSKSFALAEEYRKGKIKQAERESVIRKRRIIGEAEKKGNEIERRVFSNLRLEINRLRLNKRQELVIQVFEKIKTDLQNIRKEKTYIAMIHSFLNEAVEILQEKEIELLFDQNDKKIIDDKVINDLIKECDKKKIKLDRVNIKFEPDVGGGLIVKVKDKNLIYNNSLNARLDRLKNSISYDIYSELFKE
ncbi:MAG: hypothetical protein KKH98_09210 [Spirochaetes bacterium]|nr:hypothetical protein [Spirochaetota bacterium]